MPRSFISRMVIAAALLGAVPARALAVPATSDSTAAVQLLRPLTVQKVRDLDFGWISATAAGTIVLNPTDGSIATTGGVLPLGGTPRAAQFTGAASGNSVVNIKLPNRPVTLTRAGGTETISLSNFTLDGPDKRTMAQSPSFNFRVGGTLTVGANQTDGNYEGTFTVTVQYP